MQIRLSPLDINNQIELEAYVKWENDLDFNHLFTPIFSKESKVELVTVNITIDLFKNNSDRLKNTFLVYDGDKPIGQINMQIDPLHLFKKEEDTCWVGLLIGEKQYWGTGAAVRAMELFEDIVKSRGLKRIELGVFEFNPRAQKFYEKLGYKRIGTIEDFTFWKNKFWNDFRMEKYLSCSTL